MAYAAWSVSFGEQPSAAKWNILGTNDAYFDSLIGSGTAWTSWTPTWTNFTVGSATQTGKYVQLGKTVLFTLTVTLNASTMGPNPYFTLPVTSISYSTGSANSFTIGNMTVYDASPGAVYHGVVKWRDTTHAIVQQHAVSGSNIVPSALSLTAPMTWANNDEMQINGFYQAA